MTELPRKQTIQDDASLKRETLKAYVLAKVKVIQLKKDLADAETALAERADEVMKEMEATGLPSTKFAGANIRLHKQLWSRPKEGYSKEDVIKALERCGLDNMISVGYNSNSLSGWIHEQEKHFREIHNAQQEGKKKKKLFNLSDYLPRELVKVVEINPSYDVRMTGTPNIEDL